MQDLSIPLWAFITSASILLVLVSIAIYIWYRTRLTAGLKDGSDVADLAAEKVFLEAEVEQARKWLDENKDELLKIEAERKQQENYRADLVNLQTQFAQEQQKATDIRKETNDLQNVVTSLSRDRDHLTDKKNILEKSIKEIEEKEQVTQQKIIKMEDMLDDAEKKVEDKQMELRGLNTKVDEQSFKLDNLNANLARKEAQLETLKKDINSAQEIENALKPKRAELSTLEQKIQQENARYLTIKDKILESENTAREMEARIAYLDEKMRGYIGKDVNPYEALYEQPKVFSDTNLNSKKTEYTEKRALDDLTKYLKECNLIFSDRILHAFHTSLKIADISPLVVMAGISGTGKSELPRRYAEALGMHFLLMAVQPRWDSPQDMFGFYNYLEQRYRATELSRALLFMDKYNHPEKAKYEDRMLLVLLDEMNLARIEYYFSEFLSKLEIRRSINKNDKGSRNKAEISLDIGSHIKGLNAPHIYVDENVLFVGTMNEDESTQTLSDKVIDRANVLRFGRPEKMSAQQPESVQLNNQYLTFKQWESWYKDYNKDLNPRVQKDIEDWIQKINSALDEIGRPFGYRIHQAICSYVANYPYVETQDRHRLAFADQLEQRVLPKLRGVDVEQQQQCFQVLREVMGELGDDELSNSYDKSLRQDRGLFTWYGVTRKAD